MDKFSSKIHERIYFDKLEHLLLSKTFNDITFNCKDGKISANRLILAVYSNFLSDIFKENPLLIEHPVYGHPESGINLPEIMVKDVDNLLKVLNTSNPMELKTSDSLKGLQYLAKQLQIELITEKSTSNTVRIQALPKPSSDTENALSTSEKQPRVKQVSGVKQGVAANNGNLPVSNNNYNNNQINGSNGAHQQKISPPEEDEFHHQKMPQSQQQQLQQQRQKKQKITSGFIYQGKEFTVEEDEEDSLNGTESMLRPQIKLEPRVENSGEVDDLIDDFDDEEDVVDEESIEDVQSNRGLPLATLGSGNGRRPSSFGAQMALPTFSDPEADMLSEKGICPICHVTCKSKTGVQIHIGHAHRDPEEIHNGSGGSPVEEDKSNIICKCGKTFSKHSKNLLRNHRQKCPAFRKAAFICEICESPFISMPALTTHLIAIHGITKEANSCICGQTFGSRGSCRKHAITCQAYKNAAIFCADCNLPFLTNGHLKQHLRTPTHRNMAAKRRGIKSIEF